MKHITRYIVDHVTIASKNHETGVVTVSKKVEETKGITFNEKDFREAEDGSNVRTEPAENGELIKIDYKYHIKELIHVAIPMNLYGTIFRHIYFKNYTNALKQGFCQCSYCKKWNERYRANFPYKTKDGKLVFCSYDCVSNAGFVACTECHTVFEKENAVIYQNRIVCKDCFSHFVNCNLCGCKISPRDYYSGRDGKEYCRECYENIIKKQEKEYKIDSYHTAKDNRRWKFLKVGKENESVDYIGAELEMEAKGENNPETLAFEGRKILNKTQDGTLAYFEHDGSLDNGVEMIFNPMTLNYIYSKEDLIKNAFETFSNLGGKSHDTSTCGLHIHYSRGKFNSQSIVRLIYLFEKYKSKLERFARRKSQHYAEFYGWGNDLTLDYVKNHMDYNSSRYRAVNLRNSDTIEIRIFKGTLKFSTYMASVELVNNFMQVALNVLDEEIEKMTFEDIINYLPTKYLIQYCEERHILNVKEEEIVKISNDQLNSARTIPEEISWVNPIEIQSEEYSEIFGELHEGGGYVECVSPF